MIKWSEEDVQTAIGRVKENAAATLMAEGTIPPTAFLFATRNPDTEVPQKHLLLVPPMGVAGVVQRQTYPLLIRLAAIKGGAVGLIFVAKATARTERGATQEVLMLMAEHKEMGSRVWRAEISRGEEGIKLGPWEAEGGTIQSRFLKLLPTD